MPTWFYYFQKLRDWFNRQGKETRGKKFYQQHYKKIFVPRQEIATTIEKAILIWLLSQKGGVFVDTHPDYDLVLVERNGNVTFYNIKKIAERDVEIKRKIGEVIRDIIRYYGFDKDEKIMKEIGGG